MRALRAIALAAGLIAPAAWGQSLTLQLDSEPYANLPFILSLSASGFDETPQPDAPALAIANCQVTYLGVSPSVSQQIQIVNGQRSEWREVTFVYRWRVETPAAGRYEVPPLTVAQGAKSATSRAAAFTTRPMEVTSDMIVRMNLPERPVWVGETFDVAVEWLITRDVERHEFVVPLFASDAVRVAPGPGGGQTFPFPAGTTNIDLPVLRDTLTEAGVSYIRLSFPARVTALTPGVLDIAPVRVAARLEAGSVRDAFGFRRTRTALFQAEGERRRLTVRPLPQAGRPAGYVNAVGRGFAIAVQASRSVVQVGDPIELSVTVRGDGDLEGLSLPPLSGPGALPAPLFSVPSAAPFGVVDAAANAKTFEVTVRVMSAEAREVPAIALPYFDPVAGEYAIATSQPIALSVQTGTVIGAADVATATPAASSPGPTPSATPAGTATPVGSGSLLGADMSLSDPTETLRVPWGARLTPSWLAMLYLAPLVLAGLNGAWRRTASQRGRHRQVAQARRELNAALKADAPAKEAAPRVSKALTALAAALGMALPRTTLMERLETTAFNPRAADQPLDPEIVAAVQDLARAWQGGDTSPAAAVAALPLVAALLATSAAGQTTDAVAEPPPAPTPTAQLEAARDIYRQALGEPDRVRRIRLFAEAEQRLRPLAEARLDAPELLADWGNAALGAGDAGRAALGWRRALAAQPSHERAARNLAWLRERAPSWLPRPATASALDSLLAWRNQLSAPQWHWAAALAFALAALLLTPWSPRRARPLRRLALVPIAGCVVALGAAMLGGAGGNAAVVLADGATLRSADSHGAPPTLAYPLPAAAEVSVLERRDAWLRIALADGTRGWLPANAVARVSPETGAGS